MHSHGATSSRWPSGGASALLGLTAMLTLAMIGGCPDTPPTGNDPNTGVSPNARTCVDCHTDETLLKAVARTEDPLPADAGEG